MTNLQEQQTVKRIKDKFVTINDFNDKEVRLWINELIKNDIVKVSNHKNYLEISDVEYNRFFNIEILRKGRLVIDYKKQKLINVIKRNNIDSDKYPNANYIIKFASNTTTRHYVKLDEDKDIESQVRNFLDVVMPEHYKNKEYIFMYKDSE
jgi:hypothetical protein